MKRSAVLARLIAVIVLGACAGAPPPAPAPPPQACSEVAPAAVTPAPAVPAAATGAISVQATRGGGALVDQGLTLSLDGKLLGSLPGHFEQLPVGQHEVLIQDDQLRYQKFSELVTITQGTTTELAPALVVKKGLLTVRAGADMAGSRVRLKRGDEVRVVSQLPLRIEFPEGQQDYVFEVESPSGSKQTFPVDFSDGVAVKALTLTAGQPSNAQPLDQ